MRIAAFLLAGLIAFPASAAKNEPTRILFLVDASASMATSWSGSAGDRMGAVRTTLDALEEVFQGRNFQPEVSLRVFGDQLQPSNPESCADTRLIRSWIPADEDNLGACLDDIQPHGAGSLALALDGVLLDLEVPRENDLVLIIVDGLTRCDRDLQKAFDSLTLDGEGAEVHIFGFGLNVTDQAELSTYAHYHAIGWPAQLIQGVSMAISQHVSLPLLEETIELDLNAIGNLGFELEGLDIVGTWNKEPISVDLSREKLLIKASLGTATVIATGSEQGPRRHLVRVPVVPERRLSLEFFKAGTVDLSVQIDESGWGRPGVIEATWHGAPEDELQLVLQENGVPGGSWFYSKTIKGPDGQVSLSLPTQAADLVLQLRTPVGLGDGIIAAVLFFSPGRAMTLEAPEKANAGGSVAVSWDGESYSGDVVTLVPVEAPPEALGTVVEAVEGSPRDFFVPFDQCSYEFRYIDGRSFEVLARTPLEVRAAIAGLMALPITPGSKTIDVHWWGPAGPMDVIILTTADAEGSEYLNWASPSDGSPSRFRAPQTPGDYEIRYLIEGKQAAATLPLKIETVPVSLDVPKTVRVGERLRIAWTGPQGPNDFLVLVRRGQNLGKQLDFAYVSAGSPTSLAAPGRPGVYEVRYIAALRRKVLATATVKVVR